MNIGILISGRGSNMAALAEAVRDGRIPGSDVVLVVSDKPEAPGLDKARSLGIETAVVERRGRTRTDHDAEIVAELKDRSVDLVCLAGYMRLLSAGFVRAFPERILNIHPSLLPSFKGLEAQRQAFEYGVKLAGCTVHLVDEELDHGAIICQKAVPVLDEDTAETVAARILGEEHALYVEAVRRVVSGEYALDGRRFVKRRRP